MKMVSLHGRYPGVEVSSEGKIYRDGKELKLVEQGPNRMPSVRVYDAVTGRSKYVNAHRLVAYAFLGLSLVGDREKRVKHKDGNVWNNHPSNLEISKSYYSEKRGKIIYMLKAGYTLAEIVDKVRMSPSYIRNTFHKHSKEINEVRAEYNLPPLDWDEVNKKFVIKEVD